MKKALLTLNLRLFDGEGGAAGGQAAAAATPAGAPAGADKPGAGAEKAPDPMAAEAARVEAFEKLIKGDYKDLYGKKIQQSIDARFKETKGLQERVSSYSPLMEMLADKYGVDAKDVDAVIKAVQEDDSFYEAEAVDLGLPVSKVRELKRLERENKALREAEIARQRQVEGEKTLARWQFESEEAKKVYPSFDLNNEALNNDFVSLLRSGVPVKTAYEVIHHDEILGGAMQYTAEQTRKQTTEDIRTRGMRPQENGGAGYAPASTAMDPKKMTPQQREEIARRAAHGEKITFGR